MNTYEKGKKGEALAKHFLEKKGYQFIAQNYRNVYGEVDLIFKDEQCIVFVEVKYRSSLTLGRPYEAVDWRKQQKIKKTATGYAGERQLMNVAMRFDVVEIVENMAKHHLHAFQ